MAFNKNPFKLTHDHHRTFVKSLLKHENEYHDYVDDQLR